MDHDHPNFGVPPDPDYDEEALELDTDLAKRMLLQVTNSARVLIHDVPYFDADIIGETLTALLKSTSPERDAEDAASQATAAMLEKGYYYTEDDSDE